MFFNSKLNKEANQSIEKSNNVNNLNNNINQISLDNRDKNENNKDNKTKSPVNHPVHDSKKVILNSPHGMNPTIITKNVIANTIRVAICLPDSSTSSSCDFKYLPYIFFAAACSRKLKKVEPLSLCTFLAYFITKKAEIASVVNHKTTAISIIVA